jgi:hypothetical protein
MKYEYIITYGHKYQIDSFIGYVPLKLDHVEVLNGKVYYDSKNTLRIETTLLYNVGQKISIGGYPTGGKKFRLLEVSITDYPVLENAEIISRKEIENDN